MNATTREIAQQSRELWQQIKADMQQHAEKQLAQKRLEAPKNYR